MNLKAQTQKFGHKSLDPKIQNRKIWNRKAMVSPRGREVNLADGGRTDERCKRVRLQKGRRGPQIVVIIISNNFYRYILIYTVIVPLLVALTTCVWERPQWTLSTANIRYGIEWGQSNQHKEIHLHKMHVDIEYSQLFYQLLKKFLIN